MSNPIIRVNNLSKRYRIGAAEKGYKTFREAIMEGLSAPLRNFSRLRSLTRFKNGDEADVIWALKDVSFEVNEGEVLGIIGKNGAGKTTILKILSRITEPTSGYAEIHGRVSSLLEVGTGFHPELTGKENIFLNGAILGMRKREIEQRFDDIVSFAEIGKYIDTPVKRYSSGMYVRLAFAVAAHLEPEILLVDEVLAVGDIGFQKKCLGKMEEVAKGGRTVLFVSHNMGAIGQLCQKALLLDKGKLIAIGGAKEIIEEYVDRFGETADAKSEVSFLPDTGKRIQILALRALDHTGKPTTELDRTFPFRLAIEFEVRDFIEEAEVEFVLETLLGTNVCISADTDVAPGAAISRRPGRYLATVEFPGQLFNAGTYRIRVWIRRHASPLVYDEPSEGLIFHLHDYGSFATLGEGGKQRPGMLAIPLKWTTELLPIGDVLFH